MSEQPNYLRSVRSFVRRQGRMTLAQRQGLADHWESFCLESGAEGLDFKTLFGRDAPTYVEIGFGNGDNLAAMAAAQPHHNFIGIEVHRPGVGQLLTQLQQQASTNVRIYCHDAIEILNRNIPNHSLAGIFLFFPDPWPKLRHHKRRIVQPEFVDLIAQKLQPGGTLHMATDWEHYAKQMLTVMQASPSFINQASDNGYLPRPDHRPLTKFEKRGQRLGHAIWDLIFVRE